MGLASCSGSEDGSPEDAVDRGDSSTDDDTNGSGGTASNGDGGSGNPASGGSDGSCQPATCGSHKWACWPMPNPASSPDGVPNRQRYTPLDNGAVRDEITCLVWEQTNPAAVGDWQDNFDRCAQLASEGYAGFDDWRLPTRIEMASIADVTLGKTGFPEVFGVTTGYYLTGSFWYKTILTDEDDIAGNETNMVWGYGANGFTSNAIVRTDAGNVARCVRGNGSGEEADEYAVEPPDHYTPGDGEVTDNYTGLVWQQGRSPALLAWEDAAGYCATLELGDVGGWRVPTLNELASTVNEAKVGGAIVDTAFPGNPVGCKSPEYWFWAAEASEVGGTAWGLSYCDGFTGWNVGAEGSWNYFPTANVRCVR